MVSAAAGCDTRPSWALVVIGGKSELLGWNFRILEHDRCRIEHGKLMIRTLVFLAMGTLVSSSGQFLVMAQANWLAELRSAREEHAVEGQGWLKLVGLESLHSGNNDFGSAADSEARIPSPAPKHLMVLRLESNGRLLLLPPTGTREFPIGLNVNGGSATKPAAGIVIALHSDVIAYRTLSFRLVRSGGGYAMRVWDENSEDLRRFHGLKWYPPDSRYRMRARFIPYSAPKLIPVALMGMEPAYRCRAPAMLSSYSTDTPCASKPYTHPLRAKHYCSLSKTEPPLTKTYGAGRFLFTVQPEGGELVLDFNLAENPACAYNPYTVCPLPPRENYSYGGAAGRRKEISRLMPRGFLIGTHALLGGDRLITFNGNFPELPIAPGKRQ